jgi:hypothetical protein
MRDDRHRHPAWRQSKSGGFFMLMRSSKQQSLLLTAIFSTLLSTTLCWAQQTEDRPPAKAASDAANPLPSQQPLPTTVPGRPDIPNAEVATQLRNVAPLPFGAPADKLPVAQLKVPKGFKVEAYASGIANARSLRLGDKGTVFVSNRVLDKVYAIVDRSGKREVKVNRLWAGPAQRSGLS